MNQKYLAFMKSYNLNISRFNAGIIYSLFFSGYNPSNLRNLWTKYFLSLFFFFILLSAADCFAASPAGAIAKGNEFYRRGKFDDALGQYQKAGDDSGVSDIVNFNTGAAWYKKGDYEKAAQFFTRVLATDKKGLEAKAAFNLADSKLKSAVAKEKTDINGAINLLKDSLNHYAKTIELSPKDKDARYNYELTDKKLKLLIKRLKRQPPKQSPNLADKKNNGKADKQNPEETQKNKGQSMEQKNQAEEEDKNNETDKKQTAQDNKETKDAGNKTSEKPAAEETAKEMSKQEARMLLDGYRDNEEYWGTVDNRTRETGEYPEPQKDW